MPIADKISRFKLKLFPITENRRTYLFLFFLALGMNLIIASHQKYPGYIDADYYFVGGLRMAQGQGFTDPFLWNYIGNPAGIPTPSFAYWMPLASFVTALSMLINGQTTYAAGRFLFILIAACVPPLTSALSYSMVGNRRWSVISGLLAILSFYYAPFMPAVDNYAIFMLLGALFMLFASRRGKWTPLVLGIIAGLMTLARSDGLLWLGIGGLVVLWRLSDEPNQPLIKRLKTILPFGLLLLAGYLLIMAPWYIRNLTVFGTFMAPGGFGLLWLREYFDIFAYPFNGNSFEAFLSAGWRSAFQNRLLALYSNLVNVIFLQNGIILTPLIVVGLWQARKESLPRIAVIGWLTLISIMTIAFPFAGLRGSFFHASAGFQPFWWVVAPIGLNAIFVPLRLRRKFDHVLVQGFILALALLMTVYLINLRVFQTGWERDNQSYSSINKILIEDGVTQTDVTMIRNPPGYYMETGRSAIMVPTGDESTLLAVAERYHARFLVLDKAALYEKYLKIYRNPQIDPHFVYLGDADDGSLVFRIMP